MKAYNYFLTLFLFLFLNANSQQNKFLNPKIQPLINSGRQLMVQKNLNSFAFKGSKISNFSNVNKSSTVNPEYRTVRNGRIIEVKPNDGNLGINSSEGSSNSTREEGLICNTQNVTLSAGFNELNLLDVTTPEIWPGKIINIATMDEGSFETFTNYSKRNDLKITLVNAGTSSNSVSRIVNANNIIQGTVIDAINNIKNNYGTNSFGSQSWLFELIEYNSLQQFSIAAGLGVAVQSINLDIRANSSISSGVKKNKVIIKFLRDAYTVKVDNDLSNVVEQENISVNAGIIASVNYGSFGIIEIESDSSFSAIESTLNAAFQVDPSTSVSANMNLEQKNTLANLSIKGIFKGIDGNQDIRNNLTLDGIRRIITNDLPDVKSTTPVVPISFSIKSLKTGETMMIRTTLTFSRKECIPLPASPQKVRVKMIGLTCPKVNDGFSGEEDIFGSITVSTVNQKKVVWNVTKSRNVKVGLSSAPPGSANGSELSYSLSGSAKDFDFLLSPLDSLDHKDLSVKVEFFDEEWGGPRDGSYPYEIRTIKIKYSDIMQIIKQRQNFNKPELLEWDTTHKMFKLTTNEIGNTNKIILWFNVLPN